MRPLWLAAGLALAALPGCGPGIPARYVIERDVDGWSYRRYQQVLDVEVAIEGNAAVGHTATYVRRATRTGRTVPFVSVFVTAYERPGGLAAEVRRQVRGLASYEAEVRDYGGGRLWYLDAGPGDRWVLWVSGQHVVKIGASEELDAVPEELVSAYMGIYSSDLDEHGRAREGTPSAGAATEPSGATERPASGEDDTPQFLRDNAAR
ncbi:MAG: hypothetical protein KF729_33420 [Sandaracinaceae bacterium]|nr:hypothetical protein [Sandaracinaceae bacterium]